MSIMCRNDIGEIILEEALKIVPRPYNHEWPCRKRDGELSTKPKVLSMVFFKEHRLKFKIYQKCKEGKLEDMRKH